MAGDGGDIDGVKSPVAGGEGGDGGAADEVGGGVAEADGVYT